MIKIKNISKLYLFIIAASIFLVSCQLPSFTEEFDTSEEKEGFMSNTGNSDSTFTFDYDKVDKPLLHMHFDENVSEEEALKIFESKVQAYKRGYSLQRKGFSTEWYYTILTFTGYQTNNRTDAPVLARAYFNTSKGNTWAPWVSLNNPGDDREGGRDYYLFRAEFPREAVEWVEVKHANIALKGTDGWFLTQFGVYIQPYDQTSPQPAIGRSILDSRPNIWLDNDDKESWDYYVMYESARGRVIF